MESITYTLNPQKSDSLEYYRKVSDFTDKVIENSLSLKPLISDFKDYLNCNLIEDIRQDEEYLLELLSFGILWQTYAHIALKVKIAPFMTLAKLAEWRKKHQRLKPYIDNARGILTTLFLLPDSTYREVPAPPPTLGQLEHVYKWFMATGEFREQALRFINWRSYWLTLKNEKVAETFKAIESFTFWFKDNARIELGVYTEKVYSFLQSAPQAYKWREDRISCTRSEEEYHLNMVGAELMNRAFKKEFDATDKKAVLLPGCMRKFPFTNCKAEKVPGGLRCMGCTPGCKVNDLRKTGKKHDFDVYVIPHASDLSQWSPSKRKESLGVVASACLTTLVEGGWELKRYGVPAQCVVLEYSGCSKHWHPEGIETEINSEILLRILSSESVKSA